jgi:hypothetical protein
MDADAKLREIAKLPVDKRPPPQPALYFKSIFDRVYEEYPKLKEAIGSPHQEYEALTGIRTTTLWTQHQHDMTVDRIGYKTELYVIRVVKTDGYKSDPFVFAYKLVPHDPAAKMYVVAGYSVQSQDGEYRPYIFDDGVKISSTALMDTVEVKSVADALQQEMTAEYHIVKIDGSIVKDDIACLRMWALVWMLHMHFIVNDAIPNLIAPACKDAFLAPAKFIAQLKEGKIAIDYKKYIRSVSFVASRYTAIEEWLPEAYAMQKLVPMGKGAFDMSRSLLMPAWRELYAYLLMSRSLINQHTPCFPMIFNWCILDDSRKLYVNPEMLRRFDASDRAELSKKDMTINYQLQTRHVDAATQAIADEKSIELDKAERNVVLSDKSLAMWCERVGRTFPDALEEIRGSVDYRNKYYRELIDHLEPTVFAALHGIAVMNRDHHMLHCDLHANNLTIYSLTNRLRDPKVLFHARYLFIMNKHMYLTQAYGIWPCIIDFSRCVLEKPEALLGSDKEQSVEALSDLMGTWQGIIRGKVKSMFSDWFEKHVKDLDTRMESDWLGTLRAASAIDVIDLVTSMHKLISVWLPDKVKSVSFLQDIALIARKFFVDEMDSPTHDGPFCAETLIEKRYLTGHFDCKEISIFDDSMLPAIANKDIVIWSTYNADLPLTFGITDDWHAYYSSVFNGKPYEDTLVKNPEKKMHQTRGSAEHLYFIS